MNDFGDKGKPEARELVSRVELRLVRAAERDQWDRLMREHHYLGFRSFIGESLRYVAVCENRWLALLGWAAAALKCKARDEWIGWTPTLKLKHLPLVANNCRFLILPEVKAPNLASRILALNLKRLSDDWQAAYGHPIHLAETFVDPQLYRGVCYRAAGWIFLGHTRGFAKRQDKYIHHGRIKSVFVRPLRKDAAKTLADPCAQLELKPMITSMRLSDKHADLLLKVLLTIPDSRMARGIRHHRLAILSIAICAIICGARSFDAIAQWEKRALKRRSNDCDAEKTLGPNCMDPQVNLQSVASCSLWTHRR